MYSEALHEHNFAAWAAARAAQRGFTNTGNLKSALEATDIGEFASDPRDMVDFDEKHTRWCRQIVVYLSSHGVQNATFGRAAKLVGVYLKSRVVLKNLSSEAAARIYPPIDSILLQSIARDEAVSPEDRKLCRSTTWTKLNEQEYRRLLDTLRRVNQSDPFWKLERYWSVV